MRKSPFFLCGNKDQVNIKRFFVTNIPVKLSQATERTLHLTIFFHLLLFKRFQNWVFNKERKDMRLVSFLKTSSLYALAGVVLGLGYCFLTSYQHSLNPLSLLVPLLILVAAAIVLALLATDKKLPGMTRGLPKWPWKTVGKATAGLATAIIIGLILRAYWGTITGFEWVPRLNWRIYWAIIVGLVALAIIFGTVKWKGGTRSIAILIVTTLATGVIVTIVTPAPPKPVIVVTPTTCPSLTSALGAVLGVPRAKVPTKEVRETVLVKLPADGSFSDWYFLPNDTIHVAIVPRGGCVWIEREDGAKWKDCPEDDMIRSTMPEPSLAGQRWRSLAGADTAVTMEIRLIRMVPLADK